MPTRAHAAGKDEGRSILIVDDDAGVRLLLESVLAASDYDVSTAASGADAMRQITEREFAAVLLDRVLPDVDAVEIVAAVRRALPSAAIVMLSAVDDVRARVAALGQGADDFLTKPFHVTEVLARIEAVWRRAHPTTEDADTIRYADLVIDLAGHRVLRGGDLISVTPTERRLLLLLAENRERVLSRSQILESVWQYDFGGGGEVVEKAISNLRKKVDDGREPLIQTVRGFGYCLRLERNP